MNNNVEIIYNPPILNPNSVYNNFCNKPYKQTYSIPIKYNQTYKSVFNKPYDPLLNPVLNKKLNPMLNPLLNQKYKLNNKIIK